MQAQFIALLCEAWREHKSHTSSYILMLNMGMERCHFVVAQIICLLWYFQHFEEYLSISIFLNPLFPVLEVLLCVVYSAQQIKWTLIKRHTFVASSTVFKYLKKLTSTDNNFHFLCFSMPSLQGFLEYLFSSIRKISASALAPVLPASEQYILYAQKVYCFH